MITYFIKYYDKLLKALLEHIQMVSVTLVISILLASFIVICIMDTKKPAQVVLQICSVIYSIPSLALFAMLIPLTGIGSRTAIVVLIVYNQYILVRNFLEGLQRVDKAVIEAAVGMGMSRWQVFVRVRLPLSLDSIVVGIRLAIVSTIGIATIGASIGAGGLGRILFDGMRTQNMVKILWGIIFSVSLVLVTNGILNLCEKRIRDWMHR